MLAMLLITISLSILSEIAVAEDEKHIMLNTKSAGAMSGKHMMSRNVKDPGLSGKHMMSRDVGGSSFSESAQRDVNQEPMNLQHLDKDFGKSKK